MVACDYEFFARPYFHVFSFTLASALIIQRSTSSCASFGAVVHVSERFCCEKPGWLHGYTEIVFIFSCFLCFLSYVFSLRPLSVSHFGQRSSLLCTLHASRVRVRRLGATGMVPGHYATLVFVKSLRSRDTTSPPGATVFFLFQILKFPDEIESRIRRNQVAVSGLRNGKFEMENVSAIVAPKIH